jgi:hypothetical protein
MSVEPFLHVGLVLVFGGLVSEGVGNLAGRFVVVSGGWGLQWRGFFWNEEGVPT